MANKIGWAHTGSFDANTWGDNGGAMEYEIKKPL